MSLNAQLQWVVRIIQIEKLTLDRCELKQFIGLLECDRSQYHPTFADSTSYRVLLKSLNAQ